MRGVMFAAVIIGLVAFIYAQPPMCTHHMGMKGPGKPCDFEKGLGLWDKIDKISDKLGITEKQMSQIKEIRNQSAKEFVDLEAEVQKAEIDLVAIMDDPSAPGAQLENAFANVLQKRHNLQLKRMQTLIRIREVLTPAQRAKMKDIFAEMKEERKEERQKRIEDIDIHKNCPMKQKGGGKAK